MALTLGPTNNKFFKWQRVIKMNEEYKFPGYKNCLTAVKTGGCYSLLLCYVGLFKNISIGNRQTPDF